MKILLVVPPFAEEVLEMATKESIGVCYLASVLRKDGFQVDILDADMLGLSIQQTIMEIGRERYDLIGLSVLEGTIESAEEIIKGLRSIGIKSHVVLGGYFPSLVTEEVLTEIDGIDSVIIGEGEYTLLKLAQSLYEGKDWREIKGMAYLDGNKTVINDSAMPCNIDDIPYPSRDLLPDVLERGGVAGIVASRGCYAQCSFCCINSFNKVSGMPRWRSRAPENIVDEMRLLQEEWNIDMISFYDSNFIGPGKSGVMKSYEIGEAIRRSGLAMKFAVCARPDQIEEDLFRLLKQAGLSEVFIGLESMSQESLDLYNKKITPDVNKRAVGILERLEIYFRPGFILFEPFITLDQVRENIGFLHTLINSRYCRKSHFFKCLRIYRGSPLERDLMKKDVLIRNGWHNAYAWQDPSMEKFIYLTGLVGSKMIPLLDKTKNESPQSRENLDRLLGKWSLDMYEEIIDMVEASDSGSDKLIGLSVHADNELARIERIFSLYNGKSKEGKAWVAV